MSEGLNAPIVRTQLLEIVDAAGTIKMQFGVDADNCPAVAMFDAVGGRRMTLAVRKAFPNRPLEEVPEIVIYDRNGAPRSRLTLMIDDDPVFAISSADGNTMVHVTVSPGDRPGIAITRGGETLSISYAFIQAVQSAMGIDPGDRSEDEWPLQP
jgi:hypothetical protein